MRLKGAVAQAAGHRVFRPGIARFLHSLCFGALCEARPSEPVPQDCLGEGRLQEEKGFQDLAIIAYSQHIHSISYGVGLESSRKTADVGVRVTACHS